MAGRVGGAATETEVRAPHGPWTLTMDLRPVSAGFTTYMHTRVWAPLQGRDDLRLIVRRRTLFDALAARVGLVGSVPLAATLARTHVANGRPAARARAVLSAGLSAALVERGAFRVEVGRAPRRVRRALGDRTRILEVLAPGVDTDVERMVGLFDVARAALDALAATGAAHPDGD